MDYILLFETNSQYIFLSKDTTSSTDNIRYYINLNKKCIYDSKRYYFRLFSSDTKIEPFVGIPVKPLSVILTKAGSTRTIYFCRKIKLL